ncbi:S8 family serine peptidase (plasmid) [Streptomyces canus]|uniref:S8 family serine peptidase n=1 Tax=Streptomyces canus TaxID=58343 RepID=UPI002F915E1A|nr:S8 family serine peptidase [Streptomyces canus]
MEQMDPGLHEEMAHGPDDDEADAVLRLGTALVDPQGVRVVARFGDVVTARVRRTDIPRIHALDDVTSFKAAVPLRPADGDVDGRLAEWEDDDESARLLPSDRRRTATDWPTGADSVVAVLDWWFDLAHPALRRPDGRTRVVAFWDQRSVPGPGRVPSRYGYGRVLSGADIDRCLSSPDPYEELAYRPWEGPDSDVGTHGTHVASIAAGSHWGGVSGVAPEADLVLVHLADREQVTTAGRSGLGTSVSLLEAVDFADRAAGGRPCAVNISAGRQAGHHRGVNPAERALDHLVTVKPGRFVAQSAGNYYRRRAHAAVEVAPGAEHQIDWLVDSGDPTPNELEVWYSGRDTFGFALVEPGGAITTVPLGKTGSLTGPDGTTCCTVYHRRLEPDTGLNNVRIFMRPRAPGGTWRIVLHGTDVVDGRADLWIERDSPRHQSRFGPGDATGTVTLGSIACGFHTMAVGAYDAHLTGLPIGPFSSSGPTGDGRRRPNLLCPGVRVLAARSARSPDVSYELVRKSGTSMAAPHLAGAVACLYELYRQQGNGPPGVSEVRRLLSTTSVPYPGEWERPGGPESTDNHDLYRAGAGRLDLDRLFAAARTAANGTVSEPLSEEAAMTALYRARRTTVTEAEDTPVHAPASTRSTAARLEWQDLATIQGGDGASHLYYLTTGPHGGGPSLFNLKVTNTNKVINFSRPVLKVRLRAKTADQQWKTVQLENQRGADWLTIPSKELADESAEVIQLHLTHTTRLNAYDPDQPLHWLDVEYHWHEPGAAHYQSTSLAFYLVSQIEVLTQQRRLTGQQALSNPKQHLEYWHRLLGNSDPQPLPVSLNLMTSITDTRGGQLTVSASSTHTTTKEVSRQITDSAEFSAGLTVDKLFSLGQKFSTSDNRGVRWSDSVARQIATTASQSRTFASTVSLQTEVKTTIPAAPQGRTRALYVYPVLSIFSVPVIIYGGPNTLGQATRRVPEQVPLALVTSWDKKTLLEN